MAPTPNPSDPKDGKIQSSLTSNGDIYLLMEVRDFV